MQSVNPSFIAASISKLRKPVAKLEVAWNRIAYINESAYLESIELDRYLDGPVFSVARAILHVILDNNSGRFTPDGGSNIDDLIKIGRYVKGSFGFKTGAASEYVQVFSGVLNERPSLKEKGRLVTMQALDMAWELWDNTAKNTAIYTDVTADQVIEALLDDAGIPASRMNLETGAHVIPFVYFEKGDKIGNIIAKLCEAEMGRFFVDETGIYTFQTRDTWNRAPYTTVVRNIGDDLVIDEVEPDYSAVINAVEIIGHPREVQDNQLLYSLEGSKEIPPLGTVDLFVDFNDPIVSLTTPTEAGDTSQFKAGYSSDPNDISATVQVDLQSITVFSKSALLTFVNNDLTNPAFVTQLVLWGEPAKVINGGKGIQIRVTDTDSIDDNGENLIKIDNDFIQSSDYAQSFASSIIADRKDPSDYLKLTIRGLPQLQIGDRVSRNGVQYIIVRQKMKLMASTGLIQELTLVARTIETYFRIGISTIAGPDLIGP